MKASLEDALKELGETSLWFRVAARASEWDDAYYAALVEAAKTGHVKAHYSSIGEVHFTITDLGRTLLPVKS